MVELGLCGCWNTPQAGSVGRGGGGNLSAVTYSLRLINYKVVGLQQQIQKKSLLR